MNITYSEAGELPADQVIELYRANDWSSAEKPELLMKALKNSHALVSAWDGARLVGLGNAISDGYLVVYYPTFLCCLNTKAKALERALLKFSKISMPDFTCTCSQQMAEQSHFTRSVALKKPAKRSPCGFIQEAITDF